MIENVSTIVLVASIFYSSGYVSTHTSCFQSGASASMLRASPC